MIDVDAVLVSSGFYNTKYHGLNGLNNRHLFLTFLEAEKSKIKVPADLVSPKDRLPGS